MILSGSLPRPQTSSVIFLSLSLQPGAAVADLVLNQCYPVVWPFTFNCEPFLSNYITVKLSCSVSKIAMEEKHHVIQYSIKRPALAGHKEPVVVETVTLCVREAVTLMGKINK